MMRVTHCDFGPHGGWFPSAVIVVVKVTLPNGVIFPVPWFWIVQMPPVQAGGGPPVTFNEAPT
jgi:hypothetical protein